MGDVTGKVEPAVPESDAEGYNHQISSANRSRPRAKFSFVLGFMDFARLQTSKCKWVQSKLQTLLYWLGFWLSAFFLWRCSSSLLTV